MANGTLELIQTVTVPAGGQANIEFLNIPQTYNDLVLYISPRSSASAISANLFVQFNSSATGHSDLYVGGSGSTTFSGKVLVNGNRLFLGDTNGNTATGNSFGSHYVYITNYTSTSINKGVSIDSVSTNNTSTAYAELIAGLFSGSAITSMTITVGSSNFLENSTASLYGVTRVPSGAKATGGVITDDSQYWYHTFTSSGVFTPTQSINADLLVVAGGGSGGSALGGGGGAGGLLAHTGQALTAINYTVTVGAGGAAYRGAGPVNSQGSSGSNSQFGSVTASVGGGRGGTYLTFAAGANGGSGGGGGAISASGGTASPAGQGNNGASGGSTTQGQGGGGGAGAVGGTFSGKIGGVGGVGITTYSSWGLATFTGENVAGTVYYAGGGAGCMDQTGSVAGGLGGGGIGVYVDGSAGNGLAFTGGGGGGHRESGTPTVNGGGNGGSGVVIIRYAK